MNPRCPECLLSMVPVGGPSADARKWLCGPCGVTATPLAPKAPPAVRPHRLRLSLVQRIVGAVESAPWALSRSDLVTLLNADGFASDSSIRHAIARMVKRGQLIVAADNGRPAKSEERYALPRVSPERRE